MLEFEVRYQDRPSPALCPSKLLSSKNFKPHEVFGTESTIVTVQTPVFGGMRLTPKPLFDFETGVPPEQVAVIAALFPIITFVAARHLSSVQEDAQPGPHMYTVYDPALP